MKGKTMKSPHEILREALHRACIWDVEGANYYREALALLETHAVVPRYETPVPKSEPNLKPSTLHEEPRRSQALGWASKAGATSPEHAQKIYDSYQAIRAAAEGEKHE